VLAYVLHVNKTVTDFGGIYTDIPPVATPLAPARKSRALRDDAVLLFACSSVCLLVCRMFFP